MIKFDNKTISSVYSGEKVIEKIYKGTLKVYEGWRNLLASGVPPLTLTKSKGVNLVDYKIYGTGSQVVNLFKAEDLVYDTGYYNDSGVLTSSTMTGHSEMSIPVKPNTTYALKGNYLVSEQGTWRISRVYFRTQENEWIERSSEITVEKFEFTTPENCYFIDFQLSLRSAQQAFDFSNITLKQINPIPEVESVGEKTKNLLNLVETGFGEFDENGDYVCSAKVKNYTPDGLKENIQYSLSATIKNTGTSNSYPRIVFYYSDGTNSSNTSQQLANYTDEYLYKKATSLAGKTVTRIGMVYSAGGGYMHIKDGELMLEEGAATEYEPYGYKIPVKTRGKNLFNFNNIRQALFNGGYVQWLDDEHTGITMKMENFINGNNLGYLKDLCPDLKVGDKFIFNFETNAVRNGVEVNYFYFYLEKVTRRTGVILTCTQEMLDGYLYCYSGQTENAYIKNIQFEIGENITEYEKYVEPITTNIYLDEPLKENECLDYKNGGLPNIPTIKGTTILQVDTTIQPSNMEVVYKGKK